MQTFQSGRCWWVYSKQNVLSYFSWRFPKLTRNSTLFGIPRRAIVEKAFMSSFLNESRSFGNLDNGISFHFAFWCFFYFVYYEVKHRWWSPFLSTFLDLPGSFSCCLEQIFWSEPISTCLWRNELHSTNHIRSFTNKESWKLQFAGL